MRQVYVVMGIGYNSKPIMAYENRDDAVRAACAVHDCDAASAADEIKTVPLVCDPPQKVDLADIQTVVDMTIKAVESAMRTCSGGDAA